MKDSSLHIPAGNKPQIHIKLQSGDALEKLETYGDVYFTPDFQKQFIYWLFEYEKNTQTIPAKDWDFLTWWNSLMLVILICNRSYSCRTSKDYGHTGKMYLTNGFLGISHDIRLFYNQNESIPQKYFPKKNHHPADEKLNSYALSFNEN